MKKQITFLILVFAFVVTKAQTPDSTYISSNANWKYLDNGSNQGSNWINWNFNDTAWSSGNAELGYGDADEATVVSYGPSSSNKYTTTYFRKRIFISDTSLYRNFLLQLLRDDGAIVYINDSEVVRSNMPAGSIAYNTFASSAISGAGETTWYPFTLATRYFKRGWNVIAVEVHQSDLTSSDLSFNLQLKGIRKPAAGVQFNGSNQYVTYGAAPQLCAANFTLECWFKRTATGATASTGTGGITAVPLITKGRGEADGSNVDVNYFFGINGATNTIAADFEEGTGQISPGLNHPTIGVTPIVNNVWYHAAVTYDGVKWRLYLNGTLDKTDSINRLPQFQSIQHAALATALTSTGVASGYFAGVMDEVRIWNYARSQSQLVSSMNMEVSDTIGLLGYYRLNDSTGTIIRNSGAGSTNGTMMNSPVWVAGAPFNASVTVPNLVPVIGSTISPADTSAVYSGNTLSVNVSDPENHTLQVTFYGRERSAVSDSPNFSIIPVPDTQFYTQQANGGSNAIFKAQTNWIVANKNTRNIKYVVQLGDCVQNGDNSGNDIEWKRADTSLSIIENPSTTQLLHGIPYGVNVGNHDQGATGNGGGPSTTTLYYNQYFGVTRFAGRSYYGGHYGLKNNNHYQFFTADGLNFISINFEYDTNADTNVINWADSLLKAYPTHRGIVNSHWIINADATFGAQGQAIYNKLKLNPNLHLMLCGHINPNGEARRTDVFNGNKVHTLLSDYQDRTNGGNGWLRIMEFRPSEDKIYVSTYSPTLNQFETDANSQFTLDYDMNGPYTNLGTVTVNSGNTASISWPSLLNNKKYEWYVVVSDSVNTITGKVNKFSYNPVPELIAPNGGEVWKAGTSKTIRMDNKFIKTLKLEYSTNGTTWTNINTAVSGNSYTWTLPNIASSTVRVKVSDTIGGGIRMDTSNQVFTIYSDSLITAGSTWKYLDNGSNQGLVWKDSSFNDASWASGNAEFGYGDGDEATLINACGTVVASPSCSNKYTTTYFRKRFYIDNIAQYVAFKMGLVRDDGAVVYVNGNEVNRSNLPTGTIAYNTLAPTAINGSDESAWQLSTIPAANFVSGWNTIAVEIHQQSGTSSDVSFNLRLFGDTTAVPNIAVVFPNGGEKLTIEQEYDIKWIGNIAKAKLEYSTNNGANWNLIANGVSGNLGTYKWTVPAFSTSNALIKISDSTNAGLFDISNANFTIGTDTLVNAGFIWKYKDNGSDQGIVWRDSSFNDSLWQSGASELGYGDGGEATLINACGTVAAAPSCSNKYITTYFRKKIFISNISRFTRFKLGIVRDDGAVVYVNGNEVFRSNLPTGTITYLTQSPTAIGGTDESAWQETFISAANFVQGWNTLAVEIHQESGTSSDVSFNFRLIGDTVAVQPIVLTSPNGGETLYVGSNQNITWTLNQSILKVKLEYSFNGGNSWNLISGSVPATSGTYSWNIPANISTQCLVKISDTANALTFDTSNTRFTIANTPPATLIRGPYLQMVTQSTANIRWRTDVATSSRVRMGTTNGNLTLVKDDSVLTTEHEIQMVGLNPYTLYYYSFGSLNDTLQIGSANYFRTLPIKGDDSKKYRIGVVGDCGNASTNQINVNTQLINYLGTQYMDSWILLGDNAYTSGTDAEFQAEFFNIYKNELLKKYPLWPTPGNHDYGNGNATLQNTHAMPYYDNFTMPTLGQAGGVPSNTEAFYSFDIGNIHFLSLDSYGKENSATRLYDTLGAQAVWVKNDLAANANKEWVVAYWHHPPYTMGSHNSDTESELVSIRQNFIRILERYGVDLILTGHSHDYERSKLMQGHYGMESTFNASIHHLSQSTGVYDGSANSCPYVKDSLVNAGTVYVVSGSAGQLGGQQGSFPHSAMQYSNASNGGAMMLEVEGNRLDAKWICADGVIRDQFTMVKDVNKKVNISANTGDSVTLTASFVGNYVWNGSPINTRSRKILAQNGTNIYYVSDTYSCLRDSFVVNATTLPVQLTSFSAELAGALVELNWITASEINNDYYTLERSLDGINFQPINQQNGKGTFSGVSTYHYSDDLSEVISADQQMVFYRLKQTDFDGQFTYSKTISIDVRKEGAFDMQVFPNPNSGSFTVSLKDINSNSIQLIISDVMGKTIAEQELSKNAGPNQLVNFNLPSGFYTITGISQEGNTYFQKIIVR